MICKRFSCFLKKNEPFPISPSVASQCDVTFLCLLIFLFQQHTHMFFKNWIYFYNSVTGSFHLTIFRGRINTYIPTIATLERWVSFNHCFLPGFSNSHRRKHPSMDVRANLCVVLRLFTSDARFLSKGYVHSQSHLVNSARLLSGMLPWFTIPP